MTAVLADATDTLEGFVPSPDVADEPRDAEDIFLGVSGEALLPKDGIDGFLKRPLIDGLLVGLAATVLAPNREAETSGAAFEGLGVRERARLAVAGGCMPCTDDRTPFLSGNLFDGA